MYATDKPAQQVNGTPLRLESVDKFIYAGMQQRFLDLFNCPSAWTSSSDKIKAIEKVFGKGQKPTYPYAFLIPTTLNISQERGNLRAATLRGTRVAVSDDKTTNSSVRFLPVDISGRVEFISNNFSIVQDFARRWLFAAQMRKLNFQVKYGETLFDIRVEGDTSVNLPSRQADPDNVQEYDPVETSFMMQGFISETEVITTQNALEAQIEVTTPDASPVGSGTSWNWRK